LAAMLAAGVLGNLRWVDLGLIVVVVVAALVARALVLFGLLPCLIATGLAMSPGMDAAWPWLTEVWGGRQSARSVHFVCTFALVGFVVVHLVMVVLSGPLEQVRAMITGGGSKA
ncbi:MAG TPA: cytochrome b/b6 domain-containing protein, partial [Novosphingobium sp.]|nr:cytochrome b/b6 domain-containing protein [Novosphingobium sp.]